MDFAQLEGKNKVPVCPHHGTQLGRIKSCTVVTIDGEKYMKVVSPCPVCKRKFKYYTGILDVRNRFTLDGKESEVDTDEKEEYDESNK